MNISVLKELREAYTKIKKEKETLLSYKKELEELSQDEKVQRFLELLRFVDEDYMGPSEEEMILRAYQSVTGAMDVKAIDSNQIMVYMGSYIKDSSKRDSYGELTYERDPDTSYKAYMDLETTEEYYIDRDKCLDFENEYLILYLPISEYTEKEYYQKYCKLQKWFRMELINRSQSDIILELQEKYEREHSTLYPSFHKMDTVFNLPIQEYVKTHHEEGFIENNCLSKEEYMCVKLYRKKMNQN